MSRRKDNVAIVGVGAAACAVCCAGPILGFIGALGLGGATAFALLGALGLAIAAVVAALLVGRRRRRRTTCAVPPDLVMIDPPRVRASR